jgi:hypothetical protein
VDDLAEQLSIPATTDHDRDLRVLIGIGQQKHTTMPKGVDDTALLLLKLCFKVLIDPGQSQACTEHSNQQGNKGWKELVDHGC